MKMSCFTFGFISLLFFSLNLSAKEAFDQVLHDPIKILDAVYEAAGVDASEVKIIVFEYDYVKALWHIELTPTAESCLDCLPSFYIENKPTINVRTVPHG